MSAEEKIDIDLFKVVFRSIAQSEPSDAASGCSP
jgi:hypothetical protein